MRYVIIAPTYNQRSAGIRVLQELQKWLIRFGKNAIIPNININSPYQIEDDDIVVYPEIIRGNPLKAKRVVRYILNVPGKLGGDKQYDKDDILVTYDGVLCQLENTIHLQIPCVEEFFEDRGCQRIVDCYWIGKGKNTQHPIVKDAIEITYNWPEKRRALAELLNRTKTFYTYDDRTALILEAMLCGCEVKQIKNGEIIDVRPVGPLIDLENFKAQLNQFIKLTWYPEMDSGHKAAEYIDSIISHRSPGLAPSSIISGLTSIIILTWNQHEYTKACLASVRAHTGAPYEVIFVDNGSIDGTVEWLREQTRQDPNCKLIENGSNVGFSKGCNQGIKAACGDYIVLLNNDVVVTKGWLSGMMEGLQSARDIGIVGPMTNNISGPQKVPGVGYSSIDGLIEYAEAFRLKNRHRRIPRRRVVGFCMLFRRKLIEEVGLLDESFGSGNFEDDDFCLRASLEGYRNLIAGDVFIHHYGSRTFIGNRIDYGSSLSGNRKVFVEKWSRKDIAQRFGKKLLIENAITHAEEFWRKGAIDKATASLVEAIKIVPEDKKLYLHLAEMLIDGKQYDDALGILESVPGGDKDKRQLALLGCCEEGLGHNDKAQEYAAHALALDPSMALALNITGVVAYKKGERDTAEVFFKKAIDSDPGFGESYTNLGSLKWASGERIEALNLFERGFILSPTVADVVTAYHSAVAETGSFERAETVFRDARALHQNDKRIAFFIIAVLIQQGKHDLAMREIEHAMIQFGIGDGILNAALEVRLKTGPLEIQPGSTRRSLSICMIVKNEELNLAKCLMSVKPVADEIIVVDTGSTDRTRAIAAALGAKVFDFTWTNNFSEARNYSLSKASGEWILVLDADEIISPLDHEKLKKLVKKAKKRVAYSMVTRNYTNQAGARGWTANEGSYIQEEAGRGWFPSPKVRLFINDKRINFVNPVHELVEPALKKLGIKIQTCDVPIQHYGRLNQDKLIAKGKEYYLLGITKIEMAKGDYHALKELGIQAAEIGEYEEAVHIWQKVLDVKPQDPVAFMNMGYAHLMLEQYEKAKAFSKNAMDLDPELREAALNYSASELIAGDVKMAISTLENVLKKHPDYPPAFGRMAAACLVGGRKNDGVGYLDRLHAKGFNCANVLEEQARALHAQGKNEQAVILLEVALEKGMANGRIHPLLTECRQKMKCSSCVTQ